MMNAVARLNDESKPVWNDHTATEGQWMFDKMLTTARCYAGHTKQESRT